ncbi:MAG: hypothetical protein AAGC57_16260 [Pseudomonadota bacterium]
MQRSFAVILPLKKRDRIEQGDLITQLRLLVEETGATVRIDPRMAHQGAQRPSGLLSSFRQSPQPDVFAFELDGVRLRVSNHSDPFTDRREIGRYVNPVMWDHGLGEFTDHRAHFKIHEAGIEGEEGPDATFDRAAAVTATASVVARFTHPVGAVWIAARNSVPLSSFRTALDTLKDGKAPLDFWLRWQVVPPDGMEDHHSGIITAGLAPFIGYEILARPSPVETRLMIEQAFDLARRMVDEKVTVTDGQTVDGLHGNRLKIRLGVRHRREEAPVCEIVLAGPQTTVSAPLPKAVPLPENLEVRAQQVAEAPPLVLGAARTGTAGPAAAIEPVEPVFEPPQLGSTGGDAPVLGAGPALETGPTFRAEPAPPPRPLPQGRTGDPTADAIPRPGPIEPMSTPPSRETPAARKPGSLSEPPQPPAPKAAPDPQMPPRPNASDLDAGSTAPPVAEPGQSAPDGPPNGAATKPGGKRIIRVMQRPRRPKD